MKSLKAVASEVAKREGGKSEVAIGDIRQIIAILADMVFESPSFAWKFSLMLWEAGKKRAARKAK